MSELDQSPQPLEFDHCVLEVADFCGIGFDELRDMVVRSAKVTHKLGNRRYHQFLFMVQESRVTFMSSLGFDNADSLWYTKNKEITPKDGEFLVYEECKKCGGEGCKRCGNTGQIKVIRRENEQVYKSKESKSERHVGTVRFRSS